MAAYAKALELDGRETRALEWRRRLQPRSNAVNQRDRAITTSAPNFRACPNARAVSSCPRDPIREAEVAPSAS